jgi:cystathionine gamma-synthase
MYRFLRLSQCAVLRFPVRKHSIRSLAHLSPQEAGKRAEDLALQQKNRKKDSMPTLVAHAGIENIHNAPLAPPLHVATTYTRPADGIYHSSDSIYAREGNPTRLLFEKTLFELETWGLDLGDVQPTSLAFSSGMMAATAVILAHATPLTVILPKDVYHGVPTLLVDVFSRHQVDIRRVDMTGPTNAIVDEIQNADASSEVIVWMESPSNPLCEVVDIAAITTAVKGIDSHVITTVVDVTMASPIVTRPLEVRINVRSPF